MIGRVLGLFSTSLSSGIPFSFSKSLQYLAAVDNNKLLRILENENIKLFVYFMEININNPEDNQSIETTSSSQNQH